MNNKIFIKKANENNAKEIYNLMRTVYDCLSDKSLFFCDTYDYVKENISKCGFAVVSCNENGKIIASLIIRYPDMEKDNLGFDINLPIDELPKVAQMESAVVHPAYRGNGLLYRLLKFAEDNIDKTKYKYFMATISPHNPASYKSAEKMGYKVITTKIKYGNLLRRIYLKKI